MTPTASPGRLPSTVAAATSFDTTQPDAWGGTADQALAPVTAVVRTEPPPPALLSHVGPRRHAHLSDRALGPTTLEAA